MAVLAGGDVTKTDYVLYEESFINLIQYSQAMPRYDDEDRPEKQRENKSGEWEIARKGRSYSKGNKTVIEGDTKTRKGMSFADFINAMAAIKGGFDENDN